MEYLFVYLAVVALFLVFFWGLGYHQQDLRNMEDYEDYNRRMKGDDYDK